MLLQTLLGVVLLVPPVPAGTDSPPSTSVASSPTKAQDPNGIAAQLGDIPVDFRCDTLTIYTKPNRNACQTNVVIRRGDLLVCCDLFEGKADAQWAWESFTCSKNVRAQRGLETVWADKAEFFQERNDLVLTGQPILHQGDSILEGERVIIDLREDHARILKPRGRMNTEPRQLPRQPPSIPSGPLPARCPIPALKP